MFLFGRRRIFSCTGSFLNSSRQLVLGPNDPRTLVTRQISDRGLASVSLGPALAHLHYEEILLNNAKSDPQARTAVIVHGLLGSGRNWRSFSRQLGKELEKSSSHPWRFLLVDQRNHGQSTFRGHEGPHTIDVCAQDIVKLLDGRAPDVLVGHSLGGKVVLDYLRHAPLAPYLGERRRGGPDRQGDLATPRLKKRQRNLANDYARINAGSLLSLQ
ncbi:hypothetical protein CYMTET_31619 [Cymbomonas tetramitiformis]|uniref:AB hydrolase-1 domain-containing protein n=1 Tax=Cymbomonas tetramitiformis TaxID=36881 RepID=A0AAE0FGX1_9CHLO|nr:hypothetical protein CYMTET_31619 [Cymbomonas tetramitiformis]